MPFGTILLALDTPFLFIFFNFPAAFNDLVKLDV